MGKIVKNILILILTLGFTSFAQAEDLKVTTYNLGLAHTFVPLAKERLPQIAEALKNSDSDVICLQEVWKKKDQRKIKKALKKSFPNNFITKIKNKKSKRRPTCKIKELFGEGKFVQCMQKQCGEFSGDEFTDCIINTCGPALRNLRDQNRECATALMAQVGKSSLAGMITILNPFKRAGLFAFKGSNGLMLFSKKPLLEKEVVDFTDISTLNKRQALLAKIQVGSSKVSVVCTHLTSDLEKTVPYTGTSANWSEENAKQFERIISKLSSTPKAIVMGDFNCSVPNLNAGIDGELIKNCQTMENAGFASPLSKINPECTFCSSNPLNEGEEGNKILDHVFIRGAKATTAEVVYKDKIQVKKKRQNIETRLSDHFGVEVLLQGF